MREIEGYAIPNQTEFWHYPKGSSEEHRLNSLAGEKLSKIRDTFWMDYANTHTPPSPFTNYANLSRLSVTPKICIPVTSSNFLSLHANP